MSAQMSEAVEMQTENKETPDSGEILKVQNGEANSAEKTDAPARFPSELAAPGWSVVTFEGVAVSGLNYEEAAKWLEKLGEQKISGLCVVTDEAAARLLN